MKHMALNAALLAAMAGGYAGAADYRQNPFTLVYDGAITKNEPDKVNLHPVAYRLNGLDISANGYTPANYDPKRGYPAVVVATPNLPALHPFAFRLLGDGPGSETGDHPGIAVEPLLQKVTGKTSLFFLLQINARAYYWQCYGWSIQKLPLIPLHSEVYFMGSPGRWSRVWAMPDRR